MAARPHQVKVYVLIEDEQWREIGTGQISSKYIERLHGVCLIVQSELDDSVIVESKVHHNVLYQKPKEDLIIWSEGKNHGMALYFQDTDDCQDIWEDICQVQGNDPIVESKEDFSNESDRLDEMPQLWNLLETSNCQLDTLEKLANLFTSVSPSDSQNENVAVILQSENYIEQLLQLFHTCEHLQNTKGLHYLHEIIKGILFLNNISLFKIMFSDECIMDVVGCLEYDPALNQPKRHREFLMQNAKLKEIVPITQPELKQKIEQIYRIQYIHDILLPTPSIFEENLLSDITNFILCHKTEMVTMLQNVFCKELCAFFQTLESQIKDALLKTLINLGIITTLKISMNMDDYQIKVAAVDTFGYLVEYNPCMVQEYAMQEAVECEDNDLVINKVIEQMACDIDPHLACATHLKEIIWCVLDPENMDITDDICARSEFLNFFYTHCMNNLIAPLLAATSPNNNEDNICEPNEEKSCSDNYQTAQLLELILDLLTFCVQYHAFYMKNYILKKNLLKKVLVLLNSKHTFLTLRVVRFMKGMIGLKDELLNHYIIKKNLFEPIVKVFLLNGTRYNMLNSAIIEIFEWIRVENIKSLVSHIVQKFYQAFESIEYVQTFKGLKIKYEEEKEKEKQMRQKIHSVIYKNVYCRCTKTMKVRAKKVMCPEGDGNKTVLPSVGKNVVMKHKEEKEIEYNIGSPKRTSSDDFKFSSSYSDDDSSSSRPHYSNMVSSIYYSEYNNDGGYDDEDEDNEGKGSPKKRPNLNS
uniref:protein PPP4R3C-like n=1 Tax=Jaculus jaculus TaxID=51337 RepID=UPI001E1B58E5|nr:protein PPP4R3C-like [Jaculus jaculus]